ncbi:MAG: glycosyltransferase family 4 protein, partial [Candidatus Aenigmatarchaeota archaeon]
LSNKQFYLEALEKKINNLNYQLSEIYKSRGYKAVLKYYKIRDFVLPKNSLRRKIVKFLFKDSVKRLKSNINLKVMRRSKNNFFSEQVSYSDINSYEKEIFNNDILKQKVDHNKILLIDCCLPTFDKDSGSLRMYSIMQILVDLGFKITFVPYDFECNEPYLSYLTNLGIEVLCNNAAFEEHLRKYGPSFAYAFLSRPEIAFKYLPLVQAYAINSTIIYDTVDLHFIRLKREFEVLKDYTKKQQSDYYKQIEFHNMNNADITLVVTEEEKECILKELPNINVKIVPNIHSVSDNVPSYRQRKDIMFIGGFRHYPNVDAVLYFKESIWPIIHQEDENIRFICVGSNPPEEIIKLNSKDIIVTGYVENIDYFFETCRVFVAPLRFGAGMKGKVGQSMSYGLPVVTTSIGAEGLKLNNFKNALITDNAKEFAKYTLELYNNEKLWNELSTNSINHIKLNFSFQSVKKNIKEVLKLES